MQLQQASYAFNEERMPISCYPKVKKSVFYEQHTFHQVPSYQWPTAELSFLLCQSQQFQAWLIQSQMTLEVVLSHLVLQRIV